MQDVVLHVLLVAAILEHLRHADHATHTASERRADLRRMDVLVELVRVGDAGLVEGFGSAHERPERNAVGLSDDVVGDAVATGAPSSRDLSGDGAAELERLRDVHAGTLLELGEPLPFLPGPDVALVAVLELELLRLRLSNLDRLEIVRQLDLLVEDLLLRVVAAEQLRLCE